MRDRVKDLEEIRVSKMASSSKVHHQGPSNSSSNR